MADLSFLNQLKQWHDDNAFQKIIDAIEAIPQAKWDYELICQLARAYNNLVVMEDESSQYLKRSIALLESVQQQGENDPLWHYRLGYAYYFSMHFRKALRCFQAALRLDPQDEDTQDFIQLTQKQCVRHYNK